MFNKTVQQYFGLNSTPGEVGIEVEVELKNPLSDHFVTPTNWRLENDNSLRGNGYEFVIRKPITREEIPHALESLHNCLHLKEHNKILPSIRAGVHVHINVQKMTIGQVLNMMMCYYLLETALLRTAGENREGNLFCLRNEDAFGVIFALERAIQKKDFYCAQSDQYRYASLNFQSLFNYGSLEFRSLATQPDLKNIQPWAEVALQLRDASLSIKDPLDMLLDISGDGPLSWAKNILGSHFDRLYYPDMEYDIMRNMREVQVAMYTLSKGMKK